MYKEFYRPILLQLDYSGPINIKEAWGNDIAKELFERGLIMKSLRYNKAYEITDKGRAFLKGGA